MLIARHRRPVGVGRDSVDGNAGVHGARLDGLDEALDGQGHGVGAKAKLKRSVADLLEDGLRAVDRVGPDVEQRLDHVMEVRVTHIVQGDGSVLRRNHHHIVGAVDACVDHARRKQWLDNHNKSPPVIGFGRHLEVKVGRDDHFRERIVQVVGFRVIGAMHRQPDAVQVNGGGKVAQQGDNLDYLGRIRRHLRQLGRGLDLRRWGEIESQRDVLRNVELSARHAVLGDVEADLVALVAGVFAFGKRQVHLVADQFADRSALFQTFVVAAGIQRRCHQEDRLGADQGDGRPGGIDQRRRFFPRKIRRGRRSPLLPGRPGGIAAGGLGLGRNRRKARQ